MSTLRGYVPRLREIAQMHNGIPYSMLDVDASTKPDERRHGRCQRRSSRDWKPTLNWRPRANEARVTFPSHGTVEEVEAAFQFSQFYSHIPVIILPLRVYSSRFLPSMSLTELFLEPITQNGLSSGGTSLMK
jgi:hypothetical protein